MNKINPIKRTLLAQSFSDSKSNQGIPSKFRGRIQLGTLHSSSSSLKIFSKGIFLVQRQNFNFIQNVAKMQTRVH